MTQAAGTTAEGRDASEESRPELRLALVMNGGVSLAVWMGGVTHEVDTLRRASSGEPAPADLTEPERALYEAWAELARRSYTQVVVDVVAGTSAGGLNGTLLATAIARGAPLPPLAEVWTTAGRLRRPQLLVDRERRLTPSASLLDGRYFASEVSRRLEAVPPPAHATTTAPPDVTLFVTATALDAPPRRLTDAVEQGFAAADHRRLYRFRRRPVPEYREESGEWGFHPGEDDFAAADGQEALAGAARASAGFPVAFEPLPETDAMVRRRVLPTPSARYPTGTTYLVDGGVLDNAPFGPVLDEIARRPVSGPWERVLCYVVPSSGHPGPRDGEASDEVPRNPGGRSPAARHASCDSPDHGAPPWLSVATTALAFPSEADFRGDVEHLSQAMRTAPDDTPPEDLFAEALAGEYDAAAAALFARYQRARTVGGVREAARLLAEGGGVEPLTTSQELPDEKRVRDGSLLWVPASRADVGAPWTWGVSAADRAVRLMVRSMRPLLADPGHADALARLGVLLGQVEAVRDAVERALREGDATVAPGRRRTDAGACDDVDEEPPPTGAVVDALNGVLARLHVPETLGRVVAEAAEVRAHVAHVNPDEVLQACTDVEVVTEAFAPSDTFVRTPRFRFLRLGPDVGAPVLITRDGTLAARARRQGHLKLYGTRLHHFGGFGHEDWRRWDWTWGRLDAVAHLVRLLKGGTDDVLRMQDLVLAAERREDQATDDRTALAERTGRVLATSDDTLLAELRADPEGRRALSTLAETALRVLAQDPGGRGGVLPAVGRVANATLALEPATRVGRLWPARALTAPLRWWLWRRLGRPYGP